jgi:hypothetical protein
MCWQCIRRPDEYLPGAKLIKQMEEETAPYPVIVFRWQGKVYRTNPEADWLFAGKAEPGAVDAEGIPYFEEVA